ncbi:MAG: hypothetical protein JNJ55_02700, partial [Betaproteobacteria bacterium]|nr:hypothetical protein [Betaproteobacteria bacterium]
MTSRKLTTRASLVIAPAAMALAISASLAPSMAHAQAGPVSLYGTLFVDFESVKASGSTTPANDFPAR